MVKKNTRSNGRTETNKIIAIKKETKIKKIQVKKGKQQQLDESENDNDEQLVNNEELSSRNNEDVSEQDGSSSQQRSGQSDDEQQDSDEESSQSSLAPENYAVRQMSFRERRGTKMNYLMNKKKQEEEDPFWQNQGQNYFGDLEDQEADEDYQQSSSGRDQFDSDFGQTESEHNEEPKIAEPEVDEEKARQRKKQQELMRQVGAHVPKNLPPKTAASVKKQQTEKKPVPQAVNRYIHQVCTQQQLLGQAAQTEYINWLSLQKLISLQNEKKDFTHREHSLEGKKVIFRDRINEEGKRSTSYELFGVEVNKISDLTQMIAKEGESQ